MAPSDRVGRQAAQDTSVNRIARNNPEFVINWVRRRQQITVEDFNVDQDGTMNGTGRFSRFNSRLDFCIGIDGMTAYSQSAEQP